MQQWIVQQFKLGSFPFKIPNTYDYLFALRKEPPEWSWENNPSIFDQCKNVIKEKILSNGFFGVVFVKNDFIFNYLPKQKFCFSIDEEFSMLMKLYEEIKNNKLSGEKEEEIFNIFYEYTIVVINFGREQLTEKPE